MKNLKQALLLPLFCFPPAVAGAEAAAAPLSCTYEVYNWNIYKKRAVNMASVKHPYSELTAEEKDPETGCTVWTVCYAVNGACGKSAITLFPGGRDVR